MASNNSELAINRAAPVRSEMLPYGRHDITDYDIEAVLNTLKSDY